VCNFSFSALLLKIVCYVVMLLCCYVVMLLSCYVVMLLCCYFVMLLCCYVVMLLCCYVVMLLCCYVVMLLCCYVVTSRKLLILYVLPYTYDEHRCSVLGHSGQSSGSTRMRVIRREIR
jgi:hypothetical protein